MIMLGAASPASLLAYQKGVAKLHERWPQYWNRIAVAEALARSTQWDLMMEDRLLEGLPKGLRFTWSRIPGSILNLVKASVVRGTSHISWVQIPNGT